MRELLQVIEVYTFGIKFHALLNLTLLTFLGSILSVVVISFTNISTTVRGGKHSLFAARSSICCTVSEDLSSSIYPTIFTACLVILYPHLKRLSSLPVLV